ncbi:MAG: hypothetical protein LBI01_04595 [Elusimicrobium sp.]|jgi:hypothetical protein|nr:hypothetical protein [Elusimicrobium sp.]
MKNIIPVILAAALLNASFVSSANAQITVSKYQEYTGVLQGDNYKKAPEYNWTPAQAQDFIKRISKNIDNMMKNSPEYKRAKTGQLVGNIILGIIGLAVFMIAWEAFAALGAGTTFGGYGMTYTAGSLGAAVPLGIGSAAFVNDFAVLALTTIVVGQIGHTFLQMGEECAKKYMGVEGLNAYLERKTDEAKQKADKLSAYCTANSLGEICAADLNGSWETETSRYYAVVTIKALKVVEAELLDSNNAERFGMAWLDELQIMNMFAGENGGFVPLADRKTLRNKVYADNKNYEKEQRELQRRRAIARIAPMSPLLIAF